LLLFRFEEYFIIFVAEGDFNRYFAFLLQIVNLLSELKALKVGKLVLQLENVMQGVNVFLASA
jgi:hypothetical protein